MQPSQSSHLVPYHLGFSVAEKVIRNKSFAFLSFSLWRALICFKKYACMCTDTSSTPQIRHMHEALVRLICPQQKHWNAKLTFEQCQGNLFDSKIILFSKSQTEALICKSCKFPHKAFNGNSAMQTSVVPTEGNRASINSTKPWIWSWGIKKFNCCFDTSVAWKLFKEEVFY